MFRHFSVLLFSDPEVSGFYAKRETRRLGCYPIPLSFYTFNAKINHGFQNRRLAMPSCIYNTLQ